MLDLDAQPTKMSNSFCVFRNGQLYGNCSAGYYCKSGSPANLPNTTYNFAGCLSDEECAGPCPTGSYCPAGILIPVPCPNDTYRDSVGAEQESDCDSCPAGSLCPEGRILLVSLFCLNFS